MVSDSQAIFKFIMFKQKPVNISTIEKINIKQFTESLL